MVLIQMQKEAQTSIFLLLTYFSAALNVNHEQQTVDGHRYLDRSAGTLLVIDLNKQL